jgi:hypothetical protein
MALYEKQEPTVQNKDDADNVKAWHVAHLDDLPKVAFSTVLILTFIMLYKTS